MCGLVAMIAKTSTGFTYKDKQMFRQMLLANTVRGDDSTGIFVVNKYGNLKMIKNSKAAQHLIETKAYKELEDSIFHDAVMVVGHNRAATRGAPNDENAHPFIKDHICLVHNGTLTSHHHLADVVVDSNAIAHAFAERGYMDTFPEIYGAFALIWYDAKEKNLHIARNKERPLNLVEDEKVIYIASEADMLKWLYKRNYNAEPVHKYFKEDGIYTWSVGQTAQVFTLEEVPAKKYKAVVNTTPEKTTAKTTKTGINTTSANGNRFSKVKIGDRILFNHEHNTIVGEQVMVRGSVFGSQNKKEFATGKYDLGKLSALEVEAVLDDTDYFSGKVVGYSERNGVTTYILENVVEEDTYFSVNGQVVTDYHMSEAGYCCSTCGTFVDPCEDEGTYWIKKNGFGEIKKIMCGECVEKHPQLSKLLENSLCSNELLSSHTNLEAGQLTDYDSISETLYPNFPY